MRERYRIKEIDAIETVTQFMDDGHYVDTGFSLDTLVKDERKKKNVYLRHKILTNPKRNLTIGFEEWTNEKHHDEYLERILS